MTRNRQLKRDTLAALSLANLSFVRTWNELLTYTEEQSFFFRQIPGITQSIAAILNVLLLAAVLFFLIRLMRKVARRFGDRWALAMAPILVIPPANSINGIFSAVAPTVAPRTWLTPSDPVRFAVAILVIISVLCVAWRWPQWMLKVTSWLLINFALLIPAEIALVAWHAATDNHKIYLNQLAGPLPEKEVTPVVWLLVDEMDYRLLFKDRLPGLELPQYDRLLNESISAEDASSPSRGTHISVPSLLTGRRYTNVRGLHPTSMEGIRSSGTTYQPITAEDTIFRTARSLGINTTVVGWYLPYCRVFGSMLSECHWYDIGRRLNVEGQTLLQDVVTQMQAPYETATFSPFPRSVLGQHRIYNATRSRLRSLEALGKKNPGFVYIHHMATHAPYLFDRKTRDFTLRGDPLTGYYDSLVWADNFLGDLRKEMERQGTWDRAVVLVTADHPLRRAEELDGKKDHRVPWLLKMPGHNDRVPYTTPIHTIMTRQLLEAILRGEVKTQSDAVNWINQNEKRVFAESER